MHPHFPQTPPPKTTSLVACFILGKVYCRTYRRGYACGLKETLRANLNKFRTIPFPSFEVFFTWSNFIK